MYLCISFFGTNFLKSFGVSWDYVVHDGCKPYLRTRLPGVDTENQHMDCTQRAVKIH